MTADEHLKAIVGDLIVQIALLKAENDRLKAPAPPPPDMPSPDAPLGSPHE